MILRRSDPLINPFGLHSKHHNTILTVKPVGSILLRECFSAVWTWRLLRLYGKMNWEIYRNIFNENLIQSPQDLRLGWRSTFQQDKDAKCSTRVDWEQLWMSLRDRASPGFNQIPLERPGNVCPLTKMSEHPKIQACKACSIILKMSGGCDCWAESSNRLLKLFFFFSDVIVRPQHNALNIVGGLWNNSVNGFTFRASCCSAKKEKEVFTKDYSRGI